MVFRGREGGKEAVGRLPVESGCRGRPRNVVIWPGLLLEACKYRKLYPFNSKNVAINTESPYSTVYISVCPFCLRPEKVEAFWSQSKEQWSVEGMGL